MSDAYIAPRPDQEEAVSETISNNARQGVEFAATVLGSSSHLEGRNRDLVRALWELAQECPEGRIAEQVIDLMHQRRELSLEQAIYFQMGVLAQAKATATMSERTI